MYRGLPPRPPIFASAAYAMASAGLYLDCAKRGELVTLGGAAVPVAELLALAVERFGRPARVVADRWREAELRDALDKAGVPPAAVASRGHGLSGRRGGRSRIPAGVLEGRVVAAPSLLLRSAMAEARTVSDPAGNAKLAKHNQGGRRVRARDDAAAAAILAVADGVRQPMAPRRDRWRYVGIGGVAPADAS